MLYLSTVNHSLRELCEPYVWRVRQSVYSRPSSSLLTLFTLQELRALRQSNAKLLDVVKHALPTRGKHVEKLALRAPDAKDDWTRDSSDFRVGDFAGSDSARATVIPSDVVEVLSLQEADGTAPSSGDSAASPAKTRTLLNVAVLKNCSNARDLYWSFESDYSEQGAFPLPEPVFLDTLKSATLTRLTIYGAADQPLPHITSILLACSSISDLSIDTDVEDQEDEGVPDFAQAVANLANLETLKLEGRCIARDALFQQTFAGRLKYLTLRDAHPGEQAVTWDFFHSFCASSCASLETLFLDLACERVSYHVPLPLPSLTYLSVHEASPRALECFSNSPLTDLEIDQSIPPHHFPPLTDELDKFASTLKRLVLGKDALHATRSRNSWEWDIYGDDESGLDEGGAEQVREWCSVNGVSLKEPEVKKGGATARGPEDWMVDDLVATGLKPWDY